MMGYWVKGKIEGTVKLDIVVQMVVSSEYEMEEAAACWNATGWRVPNWQHKYLNETEDGLDYAEEEVELPIEFDEVPIPFTLEGYEEKITCLNQGLEYEVRTRKLRSKFEADLWDIAPEGTKDIQVKLIDVNAVFDGVGEDDEPVVDIDVSCLVCPRR